MRRARPASLATVALLLVAGAAAAEPAAADRAATPAQLRSRWQHIAGEIGGKVGVAAVLVETGERVAVNGAARFPMASVYKFPIALAVLDGVDRGGLRLADSLALLARDLRPGAGALKLPPGSDRIFVRVDRLLALAVGESDNTASDALLRSVGGPAAVMRRLRGLGITGIDVSRFEVGLMADWSGVAVLPPEPQWTRERIDSLVAAVPPGRRQAAGRAYETDPRDTATPEAMAQLLAKFHLGGALSPAGTARLRRLMEDTATGSGRIKGRLPAGTVVAHKTGTMGTVCNDVGVVTLPGGRGHLALAVFLKGSAQPRARLEWAIAELARAAYDYFAAPPTAPPAPPPRSSSPR